MGEVPRHRWSKYDERQIVAAEAADQERIDAARAELDELSLLRRIIHLSRTANLYMTISNGNGKIRERRRMYGDMFPSDLDDDTTT